MNTYWLYPKSELESQYLNHEYFMFGLCIFNVSNDIVFGKTDVAICTCIYRMSQNQNY